jgi:hypothetical protein
MTRHLTTTLSSVEWSIWSVLTESQHFEWGYRRLSAMACACAPRLRGRCEMDAAAEMDSDRGQAEMMDAQSSI